MSTGNEVGITPKHQQTLNDLSRIRYAGNNLATAAHRVQMDFDGIHRLRLALRDWYHALANEGGRGVKYDGLMGRLFATFTNEEIDELLLLLREIGMIPQGENTE